MSLQTETYPTELRLGCGTDTKSGSHNVDIEPLDGVDEVVNLNETPWPWPVDTFEYIVAEHVFEHLNDVETTLRECARVLKPGGRLRVVMPMGANAVADPDHEHVWMWTTPEYYCGARHWDVDVGLSVVSKDVSMHSHDRGIVRAIRRRVWKYQLRRYGPGQWCFNLPTMSGEFEVVFEA